MKHLTDFVNSNEFVNECIIVAKKFDDKFVLAKNRDRPYDPSLTLMHTVVDDVEMIYLLDNDTDWSEGMNEYGIAIVNSALMVGRDESEKKVVKKTGQKLKDGSIIREALKFKNVDDVIEHIKSKSGGLKGHTFIATADKLYAVELTSKHQVEVTELHDKSMSVRTNHGIKHPTAGYQEGLSYKSSAIRKVSAQKQVEKAATPAEVLERLRKRLYKKNSQLNMKRDTDTLWTSSQLLLDTANLTATLVAFKDKIVDANIVTDLPNNYTPKLKPQLELI